MESQAGGDTCSAGARQCGYRRRSTRNRGSSHNGRGWGRGEKKSPEGVGVDGTIPDNIHIENYSPWSLESVTPVTKHSAVYHFTSKNRKQRACWCGHKDVTAPFEHFENSGVLIFDNS